MDHRDTLIDPRAMVLQKIRETSQRIQLHVGLDRAIPLTDWWFYFLVNKFNYVLYMWFKILVVGADWQPTERDETLSSIFAFGFIDVLLDLIDDLA